MCSFLFFSCLRLAPCGSNENNHNNSEIMNSGHSISARHCSGAFHAWSNLTLTSIFSILPITKVKIRCLESLSQDRTKDSTVSLSDARMEIFSQHAGSAHVALVERREEDILAGRDGTEVSELSISSSKFSNHTASEAPASLGSWAGQF